ncbi:MAG: hypothetical protein KDC18_04975 [Alphaproteobacteria bacterium]|nr:hypothetical protein [Alphaproteobacteria bacterium]MCB9930773.1 hypothetical protein [Alphaproteobacteria bacterium]
MRWIVRILALLLLAVHSPSVQAKIVGILFDTSGSMRYSDQLPSFGMQLLAGTIDGRAGHDRVVLMNFNDYLRLIEANPQLLHATPGNIERVRRQLAAAGTRPIEVLNARAHQDLVDQVRQMFVSIPDLGTPYGPIEVMLATLAGQVRDDEPAYLVIVSDGEYNPPGLPPAAALPDRFRAYKDRFPGGLRVEYLFIRPQDPQRAAKLMRNVDDQGVRDALLSVFNDGSRRSDGTPVGAWTVSNGRQMWDALRDIIASVSGSNLGAQRRFVRYDGNTVRIETPLSIAHVVAVSTAPAGVPPAEWQDSSFDRAPTATRRIAARMDHGDEALAAPPLHGVVEHQWFQNAVAPGQYAITFSRPVSESVFLLFQTQAVTDLRVFDAGGKELRAPPGSPIRLMADGTYTFQAQLFDGASGRPAPVALSGMPDSLTMALQLAGPAGPGPQSMEVDRAGNRGVATWTPTRRGAVQARSQATVPGFLSPLSPVVDLEVISGAAALSVSPLQPTTGCDGCTSDALRSRVSLNGPDAELATFTVTARGDLDGAVTIAAEDLPSYVEIRTDSGRKVEAGQPIPMAAGETRRFSLWRLGTLAGSDLRDGKAAALAFAVAPAAPWSGEAVTVNATLTLDVPPLTLRLVSVSQSSEPGSLNGLVVPARELTRGNFSAQYALDNAVIAPDPETADETVAVNVDGLFGGLVGSVGRVADARTAGILGIDVRPVSSFWCLCFLGLEHWYAGTDRHEATVTYTDPLKLQSASSRLPLYLPIAWQQTGLSCALNLLYLLLLVMLLRGVLAWVRTNRFPSRSVIEVQEGRSLPRFQRLRGNNYTWARVWFALFTGDPHEVRTIQGLRLTATPDGALLDLAGKSVPPWTLERMGQTFEELREQSRDMETFRLIWGDRLEHTVTRGLAIRLKRNVSDE